MLRTGAKEEELVHDCEELILKYTVLWDRSKSIIFLEKFGKNKTVLADFLMMRCR